MSNVRQLWSKRPLFMFLLSALIGTAAFSYFVSGWTTLKNTNNNINGPQEFTVSGEGKVAVKPDTAVFTASVVTEAPKISDAQRQNTERANSIIDYLKKNDIGEKDIKTIGYTIYPQYQYYDIVCREIFCPPRRPPEIRSYQVRNSLEITVRDLTKADDLLEGVVSNGANEIGSISFKLDDEKKALEQARDKAIDEAKQKAYVLAKQLGVRLIRIVGFSEIGSGIPPPFFRSFAELGKGGENDISVPAPQVEPGEQGIVSSVSITYEFR